MITKKELETMRMKSLTKYIHMIDEISDERNPHETSNDGIWIYMKDGWENQEGSTLVHEYTVKECIERIKEFRDIR